MKPVTLREAASSDVDAALEWYRGEAGPGVAQRFVDALEAALRLIANHPPAGSSHYAQELDLPGLRCWPLTGFPYLLFYVERDGAVDVWRVLHGHRDVPETLRWEE